MAIKLAQEQGVEPDYLYVMRLLEEAGVCFIPGSGFGQRPGTHHFRATILPPLEVFRDMLERFHTVENISEGKMDQL